MQKNKPQIRMEIDIRRIQKFVQEGNDVSNPMELPVTPEFAMVNRDQ